MIIIINALRFWDPVNAPWMLSFDLWKYKEHFWNILNAVDSAWLGYFNSIATSSSDKNGNFMNIK
jgi:hypothetical protein